jgi:hypothetical protein
MADPPARRPRDPAVPAGASPAPADAAGKTLKDLFDEIDATGALPPWARTAGDAWLAACWAEEGNAAILAAALRFAARPEFAETQHLWLHPDPHPEIAALLPPGAVAAARVRALRAVVPVPPTMAEIEAGVTLQAARWTRRMAEAKAAYPALEARQKAEAAARAAAGAAGGTKVGS